MEHEQLEQNGRVQRRANPRPVGVGGTASSVLGLQQSVGNAAVSSVLRVQRRGLDDLLDPWEGEGPASAGGGGGAATPEAAGVPATGAGATEGSGAPGGGVNELGSVARVGTLIADTIVASSYTPGAGNIW